MAEQGSEAVARFVSAEQEQAAIQAVEAVVSGVVAQAHALEVRTAEEANAATEFLSELATARRRSETARTALVKPLNDHVKMINAQFKTTTEPLDEADKVVRAKVLGYNREQEALRAAEQARLDAEQADREQAAAEQRRREEAEAAAAREAAAREAAKAEADAAAARKQREKELAEAASDAERQVADFDGPALAAAAKLADAVGAAARTELKRRRDARVAQEQAAAARAREDAARDAEQAVRDAPLPDVVGAVAAPVAAMESASGSVATRKRWVFEIEDPERVPRTFLAIDEKAIREAVRKGERSIPGVRIFQEDGLAVRAR